MYFFSFSFSLLFLSFSLSFSFLFFSFILSFSFLSHTPLVKPHVKVCISASTTSHPYPYYPDIRIDMTSPVTTYVEPGPGPTCESTFTMAFLIPEEHQEDPPAPPDNTIFIEDRPEMRVLTRQVIIKDLRKVMNCDVVEKFLI